VSSTQYDFAYLKTGLEILEDYLLAPELYWPVENRAPAGELAFPRLTLDTLLLSQTRLQAQALTPQQQAALNQLSHQMEALRSTWRAAWERKAARGYHARLSLWSDFLEEVNQQPEEHAGRYPYEVRQRVMLALLIPQAGDLPQAEIERLAHLDQRLRAIFQPGAFVWPIELADGFSSEKFWYLYGRPSGR
jgi:hypothetical protein